ncbi:hypothetical protein JKG68_30540 [Microvirga aerilata]|uniref:Uncharacterized protein n=1 Tax=Microvirga aerilata TaxID=670292 RepID=A0A937D0Z4_9HYPH|nr:hypothetical protein [Microvirga aerilata]MBL0408224.1 hypothetical protein [Microvirga aerilata]
MTLLELERAVYAAAKANDSAEMCKVVSGYVEQERHKAAERQRRCRASQQRHSNAPHARVVNTNLPKEEKERSSLPREWRPTEGHRKRVEEQGRLPDHLNFVETLFRAWVDENALESINWDASFSKYLENNFVMYPNANQFKGKGSPQGQKGYSIKPRASSALSETQIPDGTPETLAAIIRLMDQNVAESEIKRKLDVGDSEIRQAFRIRRQQRVQTACREN